MQISGFQPISLLDYPDHLACIVFTPGCNFKCPYCHNPEFVDPNTISKNETVSEEFILDFLKTRRGKLEGVVITGGEPTLQKDLLSFVKKIKTFTFKVKLDTNGSDPLMLKKLFSANLLDYIAMDIKAPFSKYPTVSNFKDTTKIKKSIDLILKGNIPYEFRSTVLPALHSSADIIKMATQIQGAEKYYLQNFRQGKTLDPKFSSKRPFTENEIESLARKASKFVKTCEARF